MWLTWCSTTCDKVLAALSAAQFVIAPVSLQLIHAEMSTPDDEREIEAVLQHRMYCGQELWVILKVDCLQRGSQHEHLGATRSPG